MKLGLGFYCYFIGDLYLTGDYLYLTGDDLYLTGDDLYLTGDDLYLTGDLWLLFYYYYLTGDLDLLIGDIEFTKGKSTAIDYLGYFC